MGMNPAHIPLDDPVLHEADDEQENDHNNYSNNYRNNRNNRKCKHRRGIIHGFHFLMVSTIVAYLPRYCQYAHAPEQ